MADYGKISVRALFSRNSDYSDPEADTHTLLMALTPDECDHRVVDVVNGTVKTIAALNTYTGSATIKALQLVVKNNSSTAAEFISVGYTDTEANANVVVVPAGGIAVIPDVDNSTASGAAVTLTSASGTIECEYMFLGT